MSELNLPSFEFRIKKIKTGFQIFDLFRKKYVKLTPEEWVRQNFLHYLIEYKSYPLALIAVETELNINQMSKRSDAIIFDIQGRPLVLIELKAPDVKINQDVFDQVAVYNSRLEVDYFMISNGMEHFFCKVDRETAQYQFFEEIPDYTILI